MGPAGCCRREFGMKWRVMLELVGAVGRLRQLAHVHMVHPASIHTADLGRSYLPSRSP